MSTLRSDIQIQPQEIWVASSTQNADLGASATTGDGRYFRYVKAGATTLVPGQVIQGPANSKANWAPDGGLGVGQANATGAASFTVSASITLAANDLAGAIMSVAAGTGAGYAYKVKSNSAVSSATGASIVLEDPLQTNIGVSSRVIFYQNQYNGVVAVGTAATGPVVGVAVSPLTSGQFGWIQTRGVASVLLQTPSGTNGPGNSVGINLANTTGAVSPATGIIFSSVGQLTATGSSGDYAAIDLSL